MDRIAIVDRDLGCVNTVLGYVRRYNEENNMSIQAAVFGKAVDFLTDFDGSFFAVFMETDFPLMNGLEAVRKLRIEDQTVSVIFMTRNSSYAPDGYEVGALAYLMKPVTYFTFASKLERALNIRDSLFDYPVIIPLRERKVVLRMSELYYVENDSHMVIYHTARGNFRMRRTMAEVEEELDGGNFASCGQSYLVNLWHVQTVEPRSVTVHGEKLPLSRAREKRFLHILSLYVERVRRGNDIRRNP